MLELIFALSSQPTRHDLTLARLPRQPEPEMVKFNQSYLWQEITDSLSLAGHSDKRN